MTPGATPAMVSMMPVFPTLPNSPLPQAIINNKQMINGGSSNGVSTAGSASTPSTVAVAISKRKVSVAKAKIPTGVSSVESIQSPSDLETLFSVNDKCELCEYTCDKRDRMRRHVRSVHYPGYKPYSCTICAFSTGRKDKLKRHMDCVHCDEKPYKCEFCSHTSGRKDKIKDHIQSVHFDLKRSHKRSRKSNSNAGTQTPSDQLAVVVTAMANYS